jgi:hypothetical protein
MHLSVRARPLSCRWSSALGLIPSLPPVLDTWDPMPDPLPLEHDDLLGLTACPLLRHPWEPNDVDSILHLKTPSSSSTQSSPPHVILLPPSHRVPHLLYAQCTTLDGLDPQHTAISPPVQLACNTVACSLPPTLSVGEAPPPCSGGGLHHSPRPSASGYPP